MPKTETFRFASLKGVKAHAEANNLRILNKSATNGTATIHAKHRESGKLVTMTAPTNGRRANA